MNKVDIKYQKANIFTRDLQGDNILHIKHIFCGG